MTDPILTLVLILAFVLTVAAVGAAAAHFLRCKERTARGVYRCQRWRWHRKHHEVHLRANAYRDDHLLEWE
ncbi:MAG: hypothetical protein OXG35_13260 [Acidobacteria bacterium]|nr:hypothetical protein [Acidobacteriota bacterium]